MSLQGVVTESKQKKQSVVKEVKRMFTKEAKDTDFSGGPVVKNPPA